MDPKSEGKFFLKRIVVGPLAVNAYLLADPATKVACLIDPGADHQKIKDLITTNNLNL